MSVKLLDSRREIMGAPDTTPGGGKHPFAHWGPGERILDAVRLRELRPLALPQAANVILDIHDPVPGQRVPRLDALARAVNPLVLGRIWVGPPPAGASEEAGLARLGSALIPRDARLRAGNDAGRVSLVCRAVDLGWIDVK